MNNFELFAGVNSTFDAADCVILGSRVVLSEDHTVCENAIDEIRSHSSYFESCSVPLEQDLTSVMLADEGDHDHQTLPLAVKRCVLSNKRPIILGGSHASSICVFEALENIETLVVFDAHSDFYETYNGSARSHACVVRAFQKRFPNAGILYLGLRDCSLEHLKELRRAGVGIVTSHDILTKQPSEIRQTIENYCRGRKLYLTLDLDVLSTNDAYCVTCPVPGGITYTCAFSLVREIARSGLIQGCDITEFSVDRRRFREEDLRRTAETVAALARDLALLITQA